MDAEYVLRLRRRRTAAIVTMAVMIAVAAFAVFFHFSQAPEPTKTTPAAPNGGKEKEQTASAQVGASSKPTPVAAASRGGKDDGKELGRRVRFYVDRLDGKDGKGGEFVVQLHPSWAPAGVKRFEELTEAKFWDDCRVFRVVTGFVSQWGISGDPEVSAEWRDKTIPDDKVRAPNRKGTITFATSGEDSRTTQVFVNLKNNARLDKMGFSPIGEVVEGMQVVNHFYSSYGEGAPNGHGPDQSKIQNNGNSYLDKKFPKLSYFKKAEFVD